MTTRNSTKKSPDLPITSDYSHVVLVHYHEVGLKGRNRSYFEKLLQKNISQRLASVFNGRTPRVQRVSGRLLILVESSQTAVRAALVAADIPGVVRVSMGLRLAQDLDIICPAALSLMDDCEPFFSFKVNSRRSNTDFPIDSMQLNRLVGGWLDERLPGKKVQMQSPDVTLHLEMVEGVSFIYTQSLAGIGGLPVGSAGKVVALLSAGIDSPVAAWRLLRRGASVIGLHFSGRPESTDTSEYLVRQIAEQLEAYGGLDSLAIVAFGSYQRLIAQSVAPSLRVVFYRRLMLAVAEALARREGAKALVTGESLGQVASQTLDNILATGAVATLPVLRPLIALDKLEIITQAERIGTFAISSQTHDDCCTLFMPRNPETHAKLQVVEKAWQQLPIDEWLTAIMADMEFVALRSLAEPK
ncbi:MAG: tRNA 4-thiouridine(8) synthase ThiI [Coriobacteriales bacterium]|jgi:thiamine biosynthesis protein ThiI|nr:tRNA 4-thiouridine(8) synthase ThiI [Coriobacteriales bacterium]